MSQRNFNLAIAILCIIVASMLASSLLFAAGRRCQKDSECPNGEICIKEKTYSASGSCTKGARP